MSLDVRLITDEEFEAWDALASLVFGSDSRPEETEFFRSRVVMDRTRAAFDGPEMVGTCAEFPYRLTLPGGASVPMAGITVVTVKPTHRRRGVLRTMMRTQLEDARERGEPAAALWASESGIYGRFGFGMAIEGASYTIERQHTALTIDAPIRGRVKLISLEEARRLIPHIYSIATEGIPGTLHRAERDWAGFFHDPEHWRDGASAFRFAIFEQDGEARAYVKYRQKEKWDDLHPDSELMVGELHALDAEAYAALYGYLFSIDLVTTVNLSNRRIHEPLKAMLAEPRRLRAKLGDRIWLRVMDVPALLSARSYAAEGELVLDVVDDFVGLSGGRFLLRVDGDGAACIPTDRDPDLTMSLEDLGSAVLGAPRFGQLGWVGRVEGDERAIRLAQSMFSWHIDPWCTVFF